MVAGISLQEVDVTQQVATYHNQMWEHEVYKKIHGTQAYSWYHVRPITRFKSALI